MCNLRKEQTVSKDGQRRVEIKEINSDSCEIHLYKNDFCIMIITTDENTFNLTNQKKYNRKYLGLVKEFVKSGLGEKTIFEIICIVCSGRRKTGRCTLEFFFQNGLVINWIYNGIDIGGKIILANKSFQKYTYDELAGKMPAELLRLSDSWEVIEIESEFYDEAGDRFYCFECCGVKLLASPDLINEMKKTEYLEKVEYLQTKSVLKLRNTDISKTAAKAKLLNKNLMIDGFEKDATPIIKMI